MFKLLQTKLTPMFHFYTPWKRKKSEVFWCDVFSEYKNGILAQNGLICKQQSVHGLYSSINFIDRY